MISEVNSILHSHTSDNREVLILPRGPSLFIITPPQHQITLTLLGLIK